MTTWTAPSTWASGAVLTAAQLNAQVRDNVTLLKGALDLLTAATTADTGATMYVSIARAATTDAALAAHVTGDSVSRISIDAGGGFLWSSGAASGDVTLYRSAADVLKTDDYFEAYAIEAVGSQGKVTLQLPSTDAHTGMTIGGDVTLFRDSANHLKTDDYFEAYAIEAVGSQGKVTLQLSSTDAHTGMTIGGDVTLYRSAPDVLKTDDGIWAAGGLVTLTKAGVPADGDLVTGMQQSGASILDTTNSRIYFRVGSTWKYASLT